MESESTLKVTLSKATDLRSTDKNGLSDPYAVVTVTDGKFKEHEVRTRVTEDLISSMSNVERKFNRRHLSVTGHQKVFESRMERGFPYEPD